MLLIPICTYASPEHLLIGVKSAYSLPTKGSFESTLLTGIESQFAITDNTVFMLEYGYGSAADISATHANGTTETGSYIHDMAIVSVMRFPEGKGSRGIYYGAGIAYMKYRISSVVTSGTSVFSVTSQPTKLAGVVTLGYEGRQNFFVEARYIYAGKKNYNSLIGESTDFSSMTVNAGYRFAIK